MIPLQKFTMALIACGLVSLEAQAWAYDRKIPEMFFPEYGY